MSFFICTNHDCFWPVGCASVVLAENEEMARALLDAALIARGLRPSTADPYTLKELDTAVPQAIILHDGDY